MLCLLLFVLGFIRDLRLDFVIDCVIVVYVIAVVYMFICLYILYIYIYIHTHTYIHTYSVLCVVYLFALGFVREICALMVSARLMQRPLAAALARSASAGVWDSSAGSRE